MNLDDLTARFSGSTESQEKAIFSTLFIAGNKLQTIFDSRIPEVSLKQFMLLSIIRQSKEQLTFTQLGNLLGCSRQNIKKLADVLMKKGFITIQQSPHDIRAMCICPTEKVSEYFANDFLEYQKELKYLFEVYTDEEIETLFILLSKLYAGIEVVIYHSQTGFTKRYARWIAEAAGADCFELSAAKKKDLTSYEAIIFGSWACAGGISKISWFKSNIDRWAGKKLIVFCVGGSPIDNPEVDQALKQNFKELSPEKVSVFYCPGGFNYEKMSASSKLMMKMFIKMLKAKKDKTEADREMIKMISKSYDISDKKYIEPVLECLH